MTNALSVTNALALLFFRDRKSQPLGRACDVIRRSLNS